MKKFKKGDKVLHAKDNDKRFIEMLKKAGYEEIKKSPAKK